MKTVSTFVLRDKVGSGAMAVVRTLPVFFLILTAIETASAQETLPPGAGRDLVIADCTSCHDTGVILSQHQTSAQWSETINQMVRNGAEITPGDAARIIAYLAENFEAANVPVTANPGDH